MFIAFPHCARLIQILEIGNVPILRLERVKPRPLTIHIYPKGVENGETCILIVPPAPTAGQRSPLLLWQRSFSKTSQTHYLPTASILPSCDKLLRRQYGSLSFGTSEHPTERTILTNIVEKILIGYVDRPRFPLKNGSVG